MKKAEPFIQKAIPKSHRNRLTKFVRREYGDAGFERHGSRLVIKRSVLKEIASGKFGLHREKEANLAQTLRKIHEKSPALKKAEKAGGE